MTIRAVASRTSQLLDGLAKNIRRHEKYSAVFTSKDGAWVLRDMMRKFKVTETTHIPGDPHHSAFLEGQRYVVTTICRYINKDPNEMIKQIEETLQHED